MASCDTWKQIVSQRISVDPEKCIGCGACVRVCPFMVFELQEFKEKGEKAKRRTALPTFVEDCFLCQSCEAQCPTEAIFIEW